MRILLFLFLAFAAAAALAIKFLPWYVSGPLILLVALPVIWLVLKIRSFLNKLKKTIGDVLPKEQLRSLDANERFQGKGFSFTFPVPCEVSQTRLDDFKALVLKPKFDFPGAPRDSLIIASTIPRDEMKENITEKLEGILSQIQETKRDDFAPTQVGPLQGERSAFSASKDDKSVQGECVYLGNENYSIAWVALATAADFDNLAGKYRELVSLIQVTEIKQTPELEDAEAAGE